MSLRPATARNKILTCLLLASFAPPLLMAGNGICDSSSSGYTSDSGKTFDFSCPSFNFDGGDCDDPSNGIGLKEKCGDWGMDEGGGWRACEEVRGGGGEVMS